MCDTVFLKKFFLLITVLISSILLASPTVSYGGYLAQLQIEYKGGSRHIGRLNLLMPIWQNSTQLFYFDTIGMITNSPVKEFNLGTGYRKISNFASTPIIIGGYIFGDVKETPHKKAAYQLTGGLELLSAAGEMRINTYLPIGKKEFLITGETGLQHDDTNIYFKRSDKLENILGGFDLEIGHKIPKTVVSVYGTFYHFHNDSIKINGGRARLECKPNSWIVFGGEYSYDNERKNKWYANIAIRLNLLSTKHNNQTPFSITSKMVQMPIRDIDIITVDREIEGTSIIATQVTTAAELRHAIKEEGKTAIVITEDIDFGGQTIVDDYSPITTTFKNGKIMGVKVIREGNIITRVFYHPMKLSNYRVRQQTNSPILYSYNGNNLNLAGALFPHIENTEIAFLILDNWSVDSTAGSGSGLVGHANNSFIHHIENRANLTSDQSAGIVWYADGKSIIENNINKGRLATEDTYGIAYVLNDNTIARKNINSGAIAGLDAAGIVRNILKNSIVEDNINEGFISGERGSGIVATALENSRVHGNINQSQANISGQKASGIIKLAGDNAIISNNKNLANIFGLAGSGIILYGNDHVTIESNINSGNIYGQSSAGIVSVLLKDSIAKNNINHGEIAGPGTAGIAINSLMRSIVENNFNNGIISTRKGSGIIRQARDNATIRDNINQLQATISGPQAAGIIQSGANNTIISNNINYANILGDEAAGIIIEGTDRTTIAGNINSGELTGSRTGGIAFRLYQYIVIEGNRNQGQISGQGAAGISFILDDNAVARNNINTGVVSGPLTSGIILRLVGTPTLDNNTNLGNVVGHHSNGIVLNNYTGILLPGTNSTV
jgi:hypothetical protein